eukprot:s2022_g4.t2
MLTAGALWFVLLSLVKVGGRLSTIPRIVCSRAVMSVLEEAGFLMPWWRPAAKNPEHEHAVHKQVGVGSALTKFDSLSTYFDDGMTVDAVAKMLQREIREDRDFLPSGGMMPSQEEPGLWRTAPEAAQAERGRESGLEWASIDHYPVWVVDQIENYLSAEPGQQEMMRRELERTLLEEPLCSATVKFDGTCFGKLDNRNLSGRRHQVGKACESYLQTSTAACKKCDIELVRAELSRVFDAELTAGSVCVWGELMCNPGYYDYLARGLAGKWICFGAVVKLPQAQDSSDIMAWSKKLDEHGFAHSIAAEGQKVRLFLCPALREMLTKAGCDVTDDAQQSTHAKLVASMAKSLAAGENEGIVLVFRRGNFGQASIRKWKNSAEGGDVSKRHAEQLKSLKVRDLQDLGMLDARIADMVETMIQVLVSSSLRVLRAAPELEFPEPSSGSGWLTFEGISVSMLVWHIVLCEQLSPDYERSRAWILLDTCKANVSTGVCDAAVSNHDVPVTPQALCWLKHLACQCLLPDSMSIFSRCGSAVWALLLLPCSAQLPSKDWCATGIAVPDFAEDAGVTPTVNAYVVQKLGLFDLYHTAMVFRQEIPGQEPRNWTVEFDSVTNVLGAVLPKIDNGTLSWNNDARYCVTPGVLWGEAHWSKMSLGWHCICSRSYFILILLQSVANFTLFDLALQLTSVQATKIFTDLIPSVNRTAHQSRPLYQLWRDITCGDGINWILHFASTRLQVPVEASFELKFTSILFHADRLNPVAVGSEQWPDVVKYFEGMIQAMASHQTLLERLLEMLHLMPVHFVYDSNAKAGGEEAQPPKVGLWPHEKTLLQSGALSEISHRGASSILLQALHLEKERDLPEKEGLEETAEREELEAEREELVSIFRHMTDKECSFLREHGILPDTQPYQTIVEGDEGFQYCKKYFCGKKKVTPSVSTIVEFLCPRTLVDQLFAMQWKIEDGARSHGLGDKGGKGLPIFNEALESGDLGIAFTGPFLYSVQRIYAGDIRISGHLAYFQVIGNHFPWLSAEYRTVRLEGPPWLEGSQESVVVV